MKTIDELCAEARERISRSTGQRAWQAMARLMEQSAQMRWGARRVTFTTGGGALITMVERRL